MDGSGTKQRTELCTYPSCTSLGADNWRCRLCNTTYYCSRMHLLNDGQRHRNAECGQPPAAPPRQQRPGTRNLNVLLFPTDEDAPRVVQTECRVDGLPNDETHHINFSALLHTLAVTSQPVAPIERGAPSTRLYLAFDDCFAIDDAPPNRAARALTGGRAHTQWAGTLIGYRAREPAAETTQFEDVGMADVPAFTAFLAQHGAPPPTPPRQSVSPSHETINVEDPFAYAQGLGVPASVDDDDGPSFVVLRHEGGRGRADPGPEPEPEPEPVSEPAPAPTRRDEGQGLLAYQVMLAEEFARQRMELRQIVTEESGRILQTNTVASMRLVVVYAVLTNMMLALLAAAVCGVL